MNCSPATAKNGFYKGVNLTEKGAATIAVPFVFLVKFFLKFSSLPEHFLFLVPFLT
jgi:hypothetical protein